MTIPTKETALLVSILGLLALTTTTVFVAYGQEAPQEGFPDEALTIGPPSDKAKQLAVGIALEQIQNLTNAEDPMIGFREDGTLTILDLTFFKDGTTKSTSVTVQHPYTPENGYRIDNRILYAPNGTQIFP